MTRVFQKTNIESEKLRDIILKNPEYLQSNLSFIDSQLGIQDEGIIDFLATDTDGKMVIVNFDVKENNNLLICALSQMQWVSKNKNLLKRLFFSENLDFSRQPKIILIAPSFSKELEQAARELFSLDLKFIKYQYMITKGEEAILFEDVFDNRYGQGISQPRVPQTKAKEFLNFPSPVVPQAVAATVVPEPEEISLTPEEIAEFMDFDMFLKKEKTTE